MNTKLTLSIDDSIVSKAKKHLRNEGQSLSELVENYFLTLMAIKVAKTPQSTILKELTGLARKTGSDPDGTREKYLNEKYK